MESFPEKLRELTHNKYFAIIAIIFFAFLTALVFALFSLQQTLPQSSESIRSDIQRSQSPNGDGTFGGSSTPKKTSSPLDALISVISGKSGTQTESNTPDPQKQGGGTNVGGTGGNGGGTSTGAGGTAQVGVKTELPKKLDEVSSAVPTINVAQHILVTALPSKPSSLTIYQLKKGYSTDEIKDLARNLGFTSIDGVEQGDKLVHMYDIDSSSYVSMNPETGRFTYLSETGFRPKLPTASLLQLGKNIVSQIGIDNSSIKPYATYKRDDDDDDYTYIELHANWESFGAPILNPLGMLNLKEDADITTVKLGTIQAAPFQNIHITDTSDGTDGYARRSDFNTITIKYLPADGKIYGLSSNIPQLLSNETLSGDAVKSPTQAYNEYIAGKTNFATVGPSGVGTVSLNEIYSSGLAKAQTVDVTDVEFIYATGPQSTPQWWCPVYVFRSFGKVQTGFESQFVHTVPATDDPRCQSAVLGLMAQTVVSGGPTQVAPTGGAVLSPIVGTGASSLQYGTAEFIYQIVVDTPVNNCPTNFNHSYKLAETPNQIEYMMWIDKNASQKALGSKGVIGRDWWYVVKRKADATLALSEINPTKSKSSLLDLRTKLVVARTCTIGDPSDCPVAQSSVGLETVTCQFVTTGSPWIHVYPSITQDMTVTLNPTGGVAYVQPAFTHNDEQSWSFKAEPNGTLRFADSLTKNSLHWEYYRYGLLKAYRPTIEATDAGFVLPREELKPFVSELAHRIGLNTIETENLLSELNRQSSSVTDPFVKVGFVSSSFLNTYLPLSITPQPDSLYRIYLDIRPMKTRPHTVAPQLPIIDRSGSIVVETGVIFPY